MESFQPIFTMVALCLKLNHDIPNNNTLLSYTYLSTLSNYGRPYNTAAIFGETLSTANQSRVFSHPIAQSKINMTTLQADNLIPIFTYMGTNLKPLP